MKPNLPHSFNFKFVCCLLLFAIIQLVSFRVKAQNSVLIELDKSKKKAWIILDEDEIGLELDSGNVKDYAKSITPEGIVLVGSNRLYSWSQIKSISFPNRYRGKRAKGIYWSIVGTGVFFVLAADLYNSRTYTYRYYPISQYVLGLSPIWGLVIPIVHELIGGPSKTIKLETTGEVKVKPYKNKTRFPLEKGGENE